MKNHSKIIQAIVAAALLSVSWTAGGSETINEDTQDSGYFLSFRQKGQLIWTGRIQDTAGTWYDIRILPGYVYPTKSAWRNLRRAGSDLHEYIETRKYSRAGDNIGDCFQWAYEDCLWDFALKGSGRAWKRYMGNAHKRVKKRVFGWWMAYPWAVMQGTVDNAVRLPLGLIGTAAGTVAGAAIVPAYHVVDSSAKATWHGPVRGVVLPTAAYTWNTVAAPPLSLLGQKPSRERVDGFWVRISEHPSRQLFTPGKREIKAAAAWGMVLSTALKEVIAAQDAYSADLKVRRQALWEEQRKLNQESMRKHDEFTRDKESCVEEARKLVDPNSESETDDVGGRIWSRASVRENRQAILQALGEDFGLNEEEARKVFGLIEMYTPGGVFLDKTDPVAESIEVIKAID